MNGDDTVGLQEYTDLGLIKELLSRGYIIIEDRQNGVMFYIRDNQMELKDVCLNL